jgi:hypothetical protein
VHIGFWWRDLTEGDRLEDADIDLRIIIKWLFKVLEGGMACIDLARHRERWLAIINSIVNLWVA